MRPVRLCAILTLSATISAGPGLYPQAQNQPAPADTGTAIPPEAPGAAAVRYNSLNRRDPFSNLLGLKKQEAPPDEEVERGTPPPGIAGMSVSQVSLVGVSSREEGRTAVMRGTDHRVYFVQEGDKFFDGYLRTINPDSVVLVRQRTFRSGKTTSDEVLKQLRTP